MMRGLFFAPLLLIPAAAVAQQPDMTPQLDAALTVITTSASNMRQQIIMDQQRMVQLQQQLQTVTAERDKLKAEADAAKKVAEPAQK